MVNNTTLKSRTRVRHMCLWVISCPHAWTLTCTTSVLSTAQRLLLVCSHKPAEVGTPLVKSTISFPVLLGTMVRLHKTVTVSTDWHPCTVAWQSFIHLGQISHNFWWGLTQLRLLTLRSDCTGNAYNCEVLCAQCEYFTLALHVSTLVVLGSMHVSPEVKLQYTRTASVEQPRLGSIQ